MFGLIATTICRISGLQTALPANATGALKREGRLVDVFFSENPLLPARADLPVRRNAGLTSDVTPMAQRHCVGSALSLANDLSGHNDRMPGIRRPERPHLVRPSFQTEECP
jgi:hypothetical protein